MINIAIRVNGGGKVGYGHYYRCLSLAKAFKEVNKSVKILFLINLDLEEMILEEDFQYMICEANDYNIFDIIKEEEVDLFILDSYDFSDNYLRKIKNLTKLMLIDDNNDIYDTTMPDILYNGNIFAKDLGYKKLENQIQLLGLNYLILREEYWKENDIVNQSEYDILITTGGSDFYKIIKKILKNINNEYRKIGVIIGPGFSESYIKELKKIHMNLEIDYIYRPTSIKKYISKSKVIITSSGSTIYECLALNKDIIYFSAVINQDKLYKYLNSINNDGVGIYPRIDFVKMNLVLSRKLNNSSNKKIYIDNKSIFNTVNLILNFLGGQYEVTNNSNR